MVTFRIYGVCAEEIEKLPVVKKFLESFRSADSGPARPLRTEATPNDQELGPPETEADKRVKTLKAEISERFKKHLAKERNKEQSSASESKLPKDLLRPSLCQGNRRDAAAAASSGSSIRPRLILTLKLIFKQHLPGAAADRLSRPGRTP